MTSMSYQYLVGVTTASKIISETCTAIWECLVEKVLPSTLTEQQWFSIAEDFEHLLDFVHCIGAIDGKHIVIQVRFQLFNYYSIINVDNLRTIFKMINDLKII